MVKTINNLPVMHPGVVVDETNIMKAFVSMVLDVSKTYATHDLTEEFVACNYWPLRAVWRISSSKDAEAGVHVPDFGVSFGITKNGEPLRSVYDNLVRYHIIFFS